MISCTRYHFLSQPLNMHTDVLTEGKTFQNRKVSSPAPVTMVYETQNIVRCYNADQRAAMLSIKQFSV